jgi:hypothetical protein
MDSPAPQNKEHQRHAFRLTQQRRCAQALERRRRAGVRVDPAVEARYAALEIAELGGAEGRQVELLVVQHLQRTVVLCHLQLLYVVCSCFICCCVVWWMDGSTVRTIAIVVFSSLAGLLVRERPYTCSRRGAHLLQRLQAVWGVQAASLRSDCRCSARPAQQLRSGHNRGYMRHTLRKRAGTRCMALVCAVLAPRWHCGRRE